MSMYIKKPFFKSMSIINSISMIGLILGVLVVMTNTMWFGVWLGLELNMLCFISLMSNSNFFPISETTLKYFLIQASGSFMMFISLVVFGLNFKLLSTMALLAMMLKIGASPFHFWFIQISNGLSWPLLTLLMTIQKFPPLLIMNLISSENFFIITSTAILSAVVGAIGGINETSLRKLLNFSSINHLSWMILPMITPSVVWLLYFIFYSIIISSLTLMMSKQKILNHLQININNKYHMMIVLSLLSLGGLPPLTGFFPKLMVMNTILHFNLLPFLVPLILSSLVTLYFYIRMLNLILYPSVLTTIKMHKNMEPYYVFSLIVNFSMVVLMILLNSHNLL
uniref:NADH-ubiquinone oxidoreductase chain 2 n=1 Tax=Tachaea chinensis TaxID=1862870 RepID=A0A7L4XSF3_9CRUS|nr:NADH dehydrogenase subunit 2 [Tachaea chinensis]